MVAVTKTPLKGLFVTGTDTGIGKTMVCSALAAYLTSIGLRVGVMKAVETGVPDLALPGSDAQLLRQACGREIPLELLSPYRFSDPLAPDQAAARAGKKIVPEAIVAAAEAQMAEVDFLLVEGAGGIMAPLCGGFLITDLVAQLQLPLLIVSGCRLGTINHSLLTSFAARTLDLPLAGILLNGMPAEPGLAESNAPHALASLASCQLLGVLPEVEGDDGSKIARLADALKQMETLPWLHHALGLPLETT